MQQQECMIVRDLLPSYVEELTSDNTKAFLEKHMKECSKCRSFYQDLIEEYEEQKALESGRDKRFLYKLKYYRYQVLGAFLGIGLSLGLILLSVFYGILTSREKNDTEVFTSRIADYGKNDDYYGQSELSMFPSKDFVKENGEIMEYIYDCSGQKLYQTCQIYLECMYAQEAYIAEVTRLKQMTNEDTSLPVIYSPDAYEYPAIYAMKNADICNEYALLLEEEQKIIYIYLQGIVDRRDLHFEEKYLPKDYGQNGMNYEDVESYNIYERGKYE